MKVKQNVRMVALLGIVLGATIMVLLTFGAGQHVNASTGGIQTPSFSAVVMYVSYEGIDGESMDPDGVKSSEVFGYSHSISNPYDPATGQLTNKQHSPLRVMKPIDKASPKLQETCTKGTVLLSVTLKLYFETSSGFKKFYTIELVNAKITSYQGYGTVRINELPKETVSFTYETIKWTYTEYDDAGNKKGDIEYEDDWVSQPPG
jgi:type VI secretion system Hcp family effector